MSLKSKIEKLLEKWLQKLISRISPEDDNSLTYRSSTKGGTGGDAQDRAGDPSGAAPPGVGDGVDYSLLEWRYGGFDGRRATISDVATIRGLSVTRNGMSYQWASGGCEDLGASGPHDAACLAALFCHVGGKWVGGKFDWISSDRHTRDLENIESGYNGWDPASFRDADGYAFVIVSKDGRRRTNVIMQNGRN